MKKILAVMRKEEIWQLMVIVFIFTAFVTCLATLVAPFQVPSAYRGEYYAADPSGTKAWIFILTPSIALPILVGLIYTPYRMWRPSKD